MARNRASPHAQFCDWYCPPHLFPLQGVQAQSLEVIHHSNVQATGVNGRSAGDDQMDRYRDRMDHRALVALAGEYKSLFNVY